MATRIGESTIANIKKNWESLIASVADGGNIGDACKAAGVTRDQVRVYRISEPEANKEWEAAREQSADAYADMAREIAINPGKDSKAARVSLQALMWLASKRNPRVYSDKQSIDLNVKHVDLTKIISDANARLEQSQQAQLMGAVLGRVIEHEA